MIFTYNVLVVGLTWCFLITPFFCKLFHIYNTSSPRLHSKEYQILMSIYEYHCLLHWGVQDCLTLHYVKGKYQSKARTDTSYVQGFCWVCTSLYLVSVGTKSTRLSLMNERYPPGRSTTVLVQPPSSFNHRPRSRSLSWRCRGPVGRHGCFLSFLKIDHSGRAARIV